MAQGKTGNPNRSSIEGHVRYKKDLSPPFVAMQSQLRLQPSSWMHDRLPEMLWAALIFSAVEWRSAIQYFRSIFLFIKNHPERKQMRELTLSGIAAMDPTIRDQLLQHMLAIEEIRPVLRPMLRYKSLPIHKEWELRLPPQEPDDVYLLAAAVENVL